MRGTFTLLFPSLYPLFSSAFYDLFCHRLLFFLYVCVCVCVCCLAANKLPLHEKASLAECEASVIGLGYFVHVYLCNTYLQALFTHCSCSNRTPLQYNHTVLFSVCLRCRWMQTRKTARRRRAASAWPHLRYTTACPPAAPHGCVLYALTAPTRACSRRQRWAPTKQANGAASMPPQQSSPPHPCWVSRTRRPLSARWHRCSCPQVAV